MIPKLDEATQARLLLLLCGCIWGLMWPLITIGLTGLTPWSMRLISFSVGASTLMIVVKLGGRSLKVTGGAMTWVHLAVSSMLNIVAFGVFTAFAILTTSTGRVAVVSYSFPVWACLMAWPILGEKPRGAVGLALAFCVAGLTVLIWPVIGTAGATGLALSVLGAMMWAAGTIYLKVVKIPGDAIANTVWQMVIAAGAMLVCLLVFQGWPTFELAPVKAVAATVVNGVAGSAFCYFLWYHIVGRLPATTAALGSLLSPAIGVLLSAVVLGEVPSTNDVIGFGLIFAAAMTVILRRPVTASAVTRIE